MSFFRTFSHLLPRSRAWRLTIDRTLRRFFEGLAVQPGLIKEFVDDVYEELFPETTTHLHEFEQQFGLVPNPDEQVRRQNLAAAWAAGGGQSPRYIQDVLQTAGFNVYVHEWWEPGTSPRVTRDPRLYTNVPTIGTHRCSAFASQPRCRGFTAGGIPLTNQPQCNDFLANDPKYIVNKNLTRRAPPRIPPNNPKTLPWRFFIYIGGETFGQLANVPGDRRAEFERLLLKICPTQHWIVLLVDSDFLLATEGGDVLTTEDGDQLQAVF